MSGSPSIWNTLGVKRNATEKEVRRAYAVKLKQIDTSRDVAGFETLRSAYEIALSYARGRKSGRVAEPALPEAAAEVEEHHFRYPPPLDIAAPPDPTAPFQAMQDLLDEVDYSIAAWQKLFNDPRLDSPHVSASFERALVEALVDHRVDVVLTASPEWRDLIERRYGWVADGLRFAREFPHNEELRRTLAQLRPPGPRPKLTLANRVSYFLSTFPIRRVAPVVFVVLYVIIHAASIYYRK